MGWKELFMKMLKMCNGTISFKTLDQKGSHNALKIQKNRSR